MKVALFQGKKLQWVMASVMSMGFILTVLNWPQEQVRLHFWQIGVASTPGDLQWFNGQCDLQPLGRYAGWPEGVSLAPGNPQLQAGSLVQAWAINLSSAAILCLLTAMFVAGVFSSITAMMSLLRVNGREPSAESKLERRLLIFAGLSIPVVVLCLAAFAYPRCRRLVMEQQLAAELERYGAVDRAISLPAFLAQKLPTRFLVPLARIDSVALRSAPKALVARIPEMASLRSLTIENFSVNRELWFQLTSSRTLESLRLLNCSLPANLSRSHATQSALQTLVLDQCRGAGSVYESLQSLPNLRSLEFVDSPLPNISVMGESLPGELRELRLSIDAGIVKRVKLSGLTQLQTVKLQMLPAVHAPEVVSVELEDLGQLTSLTVAPGLLIDLTATHLPRLGEIMAESSRHRGWSGDESSSPLPIRNLTIHHAPCLQSLYLDRRCLEGFLVRHTPNLRTLVIAAPVSPLRYSPRFGGDETRNRNGELIDRWLSSVAESDGPTSLDLSGLPLAGVDLSPLAQNRRIKELVLVNTGVRAEQLAAIGHGNRIKSLNLKGCEINQAELLSLFSAYDGIERLQIDTNHLETLEIVDQPQLIQLFSTATRGARKVRIIGCPKLTGHLTLGRSVEHLEIRGAQSLKGLTVKGPLPEGTVLEGFRDLEVVELAGRNVNEAHLTSLLNCQALSELTLASPTISALSFQEINRFSELQVLKLPGAKLSDDVVTGWDALQHLREIDLSHSDVTGQVLQSLSQYSNLRSLKLDHTKVLAEDLAVIGKFKSLVEIDLAGVGITPSHLQRCLDRLFIDRINLAGTAVGSEVVDILASDAAKRLVFVGLKDCRLSDGDILKISTAHPRLAMDIGGNALSDRVVRDLTAQGRLIDCDDRFAFEVWLQRLSVNQPGAGEGLSVRSVSAQASDFFKSLLAGSPRPRSLGRHDRSDLRMPIRWRRAAETWKKN